uniref:Uncharacterized protein n=1 Tax=Oryza brachyantha TaxID=4533 RepID=J3MZ21_ORYBR
MADPTGARRALRILREASAMTRGRRARMLLVALVVFAINFALVMLLARMARPAVSLGATVRPFYEIEENSTKSASGGAEGKELSLPPLWKLHITGLLFWDVSTVVAIFFFCKCCLPGTGAGQHSLWSQCTSVAMAIIVWEVTSSFASGALEANGFQDLSHKFDDIFGSGYLLTAVVIAREDVLWFRAVERAWELAALRIKDVTAIGVMVLLVEAALDLLYRLAWNNRLREREVIFSLVAALLHVVMQSFLCCMILALYNE